ncbi:hypothetical protein SAMN05443248_0733 [Bradyrhizobium erythrophlei]|jgi:hypothetical protein|uniref:Membrane bound FAD containing D-sorbitol dehydrogenase n=2 Tax=Bradyrhizobium erythrophlei TaxID=1437360 RepID=A0A1M5I048_9BRAD|nr:hypothetical protein SAMN05443248_0733 [Bradyrhizobium erythrophlei]
MIGGNMSTSPHHGRNRIARSATDDEQAGEVSRRTMLVGAVATTAVAAVGASDMAAYAHTANPDLREDMMAFLVLSAALTGIHVINLAPEFSQRDPNDSTKLLPILEADPGIDPINVKNDYFNWVNVSDAATFEKLLQIAKDHRQSAPEIISQANANDDTKYMARSIVLLWYLGSWYKPQDLKKFSAPGAPLEPIPSQVVSAKAYTQGLVWQIAQAHPMGYSNLQFGYWSREPVDPNDKNSPLGFITATIP